MRDRKHDMFLGADGHLFAMARQLRLHETEAEKLLWSRLCNKQLGVKFRRQHPIYNYVVDFYCHSGRLVIEVDGLVHSTREAELNDKVRTQAFTEFNIEVMRFTNDEVLFEMETVLHKVRLHLKKFHHAP